MICAAKICAFSHDAFLTLILSFILTNMNSKETPPKKHIGKFSVCYETDQQTGLVRTLQTLKLNCTGWLNTTLHCMSGVKKKNNDILGA